MSSLFRIFSSRIWSNSYFFSRLSMIVEISDVFTTLSFSIFSWVLFINLVMALCWALLLCFGLSIVMALQFKGNSGLVGLVLRCHRKGDCSVQLVLEKLNTTSWECYINNRDRTVTFDNVLDWAFHVTLFGCPKELYKCTWQCNLWLKHMHIKLRVCINSKNDCLL